VVVIEGLVAINAATDVLVPEASRLCQLVSVDRRSRDRDGHRSAA
jgi:hypothetical protein